MKQVGDIIARQVESSINSQRVWEEFVKSADEELKRHCIRFNVSFDGRVPEMDDVDDLPYLESLAKQYCTDNGSEIQAAAMALVLSLFYLRVDRILCNHSQSYQIHG